MNRVWRPRAMCSQPAGDCAVKRVTTSTKRTPTAVGRGAGSRSVKSQRRRSSLYQYASRGREVSVRIQQADDSESEIQEAIFCGLWRVRRRRGEKLLEDKLEAGCAPLALWQAATQNLLPTDSLLPPPIDGLMNGLPLAHELLAHVRNPDAQPHSINLTQLPISEADRLFSHVSVGREIFRFVPLAMARAISTPRGYAMSGIYAVRTP